MKLTIDFDSVLARLMEPWMEWLYHEEIANEIHPLSDITSYSWMVDQYGTKSLEFFLVDPIACYDKVFPYPGAKQFMQWCDLHFDVEIVTHSCNKETEIAKLNWAEKYLDFTKIRFFDKLDDKFKYVKGTILVDDYPAHICKSIIHNEMPGIVLDHNKENGWSKVESYFDLTSHPKFDWNKLEYVTNFQETQKAIIRLGEQI